MGHAGNFQTCRPNLVGPVHITGSRNQYFTTTGGPLLASCVLPLVTGTPLSMVEPCPAGTPTGLQGFNPSNMTVDGVPPGQPIPGQAIGPWQRPGASLIGDVGRNSFRGPGFFQSDFALAKNISLAERVDLQFRADAFNLFNKVNLANPDPVVDAPSGGQISSLAVGAMQRQLQFSLHLTF